MSGQSAPFVISTALGSITRWYVLTFWQESDSMHIMYGRFFCYALSVLPTWVIWLHFRTVGARGLPWLAVVFPGPTMGTGRISAGGGSVHPLHHGQGAVLCSGP